MNRRTKRRAERLKQVLDAAMAIIAEHGLEALTIARLAKRVDASVGGLYRYFASKEELLVQVEERAIAAFHKDQQARIAEARAYLEAGGRVAPDDQPAALLRAMVSVIAYVEDAEVAPTRHRPAALDAYRISISCHSRLSVLRAPAAARFPMASPALRSRQGCEVRSLGPDILLFMVPTRSRGSQDR